MTTHCEDELVVSKDEITAAFIQGKSLHIAGIPAGEEDSAHGNGIESEDCIPSPRG